MKFICFQLFALLLSTAIFAQDQPNTATPPEVKFGKLKPEDFAPIPAFEKDKQAHAIILYDKGTYTYDYSSNEGFNVLYQYHQRIKILDKTGVNEAIRTIIHLQMKSSGKEEFVSNINGYTHSLVDGKVVKEKMEKSAIFKDRLNDNYGRIKFTLPNVQVGSIIEFEYSLKSDRTGSLKSWYFQNTEHPIVWSELQLRVPEYWNYSTVLLGYENIAYTKRDQMQVPAPFLPLRGGETQAYTMNLLTWGMQNVPALRETEYTNSIRNYLAHFRFHLTNFTAPNMHGFQRNMYEASSWEKIAQNYGESDYFFKELEKTDYLDADVNQITAQNATPYDRMYGVLDWLKKTMKWNEFLGDIPDEKLEKAFKLKQGNIASINLLLVAALRKAGITAHPALLSTRQNGAVIEALPSDDEFNYVIAVATADNKTYLLDATAPYSVPNLLPIRAVNGDALVLMKEDKKVNAGWVPTENPDRSAINTMYDLVLDEKGTLSGKLTRRFTNYEAMKEREKYNSFKNEAEYISNIQKENLGLNIKNISIKEVKNLDKPLTFQADIIIENKVELSNNLMYIPALPYESITQNPFQTAERKTPVIFEYLKKEETFVKIKLPDTYQVDELPKNESLTMPDGKTQLSISYQNKDNTIELNSKYLRNISSIPATDYSALSGLFNKMIAKHREQIVLKKK